jgi:peroxiredoxin
MMKALALSLVLALSVLAHSQALAAQASETPFMKPLPVGQAFPDLTFKSPVTAKEAQDLGTGSGGKPVRLADVKAQAVIFVVYSMYCPFCQREAPELNKLHALITSRGLSDKLKLVGMGAGNSPFEVDVFRQKFSTPFPLLADQDFNGYKALGQVGTPYYYVLKRQGDGFVIADGALGCMTSAETFLDTVVEKTGLPKGK